MRAFIAMVALLAFCGSVHAESRAVVRMINAKLARYVHPTGKCAIGSERLATLYGNGDGNVGKPVACGGRLDRKRPTVAVRDRHKYPCGTKLRIHNPHNGHSVTATVTDRGPYTIAWIDLGPAVTSALRLDTSSYVCVAGND